MEIQNEDKSKICSLCCELCCKNYEVVNDVTKQMFTTLLLQPDLSASKEPVICNRCAKYLEKCCSFKWQRVDTEDSINSFASVCDNAKLDITQFYLNRCEDGKKVDLTEDHTVCRLCIKFVMKSSCVSLNDESKDVTSLRISLNEYFPEVNLYITEDPVLCQSCHITLWDYSYFMRICSHAVNNMKCQSGLKDTISKDQSEAKLLLHFPVKFENDAFGTSVSQNHFENEDCRDILPRHEDLVGVGDVGLGIKNEVTIKTEQADNERNSEESTVIYRCEICDFSTKYKYGLKKHQLVHTDDTEVTTYRCSLCPFKTKYKNNLKKHMTVHQDASEITLYQCEMCLYKAKSKSRLREHAMVHKDASQIRFHECDTCPFKTKYKFEFNKHLLTHKDPSEVVEYQCASCPYKTIFKDCLKKHMLVHNNDAGQTKFRCDICGYKSKYKGCLKSHLITHKDPSEVTTYPCQHCDFRTKYRRQLKTHMLVHLKATQVEMYRCEVCEFKTKRKQSLKKHMLLHQDGCQAGMYRCEICGLRTKLKCSLKKHLASHKEKEFEQVFVKSEVDPGP